MANSQLKTLWCWLRNFRIEDCGLCVDYFSQTAGGGQVFLKRLRSLRKWINRLETGERCQDQHS
jgi:hypothetical protein